MVQNPFLLAADNPEELLKLLRSGSDIASTQDEHGYSLLHAAASYNHLSLLRALVLEFCVDVNLKDEDGETALFVVETTECATVLVNELHADTTIRGDEGQTARERISAEGDFPEVANYLQSLEVSEIQQDDVIFVPSGNFVDRPPPPVPEGLSIDVGTMMPDDVGGNVVDPEFKRRIEALAAREDFEGAEGQEQLRILVTEVLRGHTNEGRDVRPRTT